jgi:hypothetical protein
MMDLLEKFAADNKDLRTKLAAAKAEIIRLNKVLEAAREVEPWMGFDKEEE